MEHFVLTQLGRETIPALQKAGNNEDANILEYLDTTYSATAIQVAEAMNLDEKIAYNRLRVLCSNKWVWQVKTDRLKPF